MSFGFTTPKIAAAVATAAAALSPAIPSSKLFRDTAPASTTMPYIVYGSNSAPPPDLPTYGETSWIDGDLFTVRVIAKTQSEADTISRNLLLRLQKIRPAGTLGIWLEEPLPLFPIIPDQKQFGSGRYVRVRHVEQVI